MRIRHLASSAAVGMLVSVLAPILTLPAGANGVGTTIVASPCPAGQPPGRAPGQAGGVAGPSSGRPSSYPPGECQLSISRSSGAAGTRVGVSGGGFAPGSAVALDMHSTTVHLADVTANSTGAFATTIVVPARVPAGVHQIAATGIDASGAPFELAADFTVLASAASRGAARSGLPRTGGGATIPLTAAGIGLAAVGTVAVITARRRRQHAA